MLLKHWEILNLNTFKCCCCCCCVVVVVLLCWVPRGVDRCEGNCEGVWTDLTVWTSCLVSETDVDQSVRSQTGLGHTGSSVSRLTTPSDLIKQQTWRLTHNPAVSPYQQERNQKYVDIYQNISFCDMNIHNGNISFALNTDVSLLPFLKAISRQTR